MAGQFFPRVENGSLTSPAMAGQFFTTSANWKAHNIFINNKKLERLLKKAISYILIVWRVIWK